MIEEFINESIYPYSADYESRNKGSVNKRIIEIKTILDSYLSIKKEQNESSIINTESSINLSKSITEKYFEIVFQFKPFVVSKLGTDDNRLNIYKVISGLELAICNLKPIQPLDKEERASVNSEFAFYVGLCFLTGFHKEAFLEYTFPNLSDTERKELTDLINEHLDWLSMLQGNFHLPYFSNAHTWWALKLLLHELNEKRNGQ